MTKDQILAALPLLSSSDRREIILAAQALGAVGVEPKANDPIYDALTSVLGVNVPFKVFQRSHVGRLWDTKRSAISVFIDNSFPGLKSSKVKHSAFLRYLMQLLMDELKRNKVPLSVGALTANLDKLPQLFEQAFPNYLNNGLGQMVVDRVCGIEENKDDKYL